MEIDICWYVFNITVSLLPDYDTEGGRWSPREGEVENGAIRRLQGKFFPFWIQRRHDNGTRLLATVLWGRLRCYVNICCCPRSGIKKEEIQRKIYFLRACCYDVARMKNKYIYISIRKICVMFTHDGRFTVSCPDGKYEDLSPANFNAYLTT